MKQYLAKEEAVASLATGTLFQPLVRFVFWHFHTENLMATLEDYLTVKEAAEYLGCSPNTLRNWGRDGKVTMHRNPINGYRLFKIVDLDELLTKIDRPTAAGSKSTSVNRKPK